jgi:hypothetical protein
MAAISKLVAIGRRINVSEMFTSVFRVGSGQSGTQPIMLVEDGSPSSAYVLSHIATPRDAEERDEADGCGKIQINA